jgi:hypothetical protein
VTGVQTCALPIFSSTPAPTQSVNSIHSFNNLKLPNISYLTNVTVPVPSGLPSGKFVDGEWIQIKIPESKYLTKYVIEIDDTDNKLIKYSVLGSNNGKEWSYLHSVNNALDNPPYSTKDIISYEQDVNSVEMFSYYRLVISEIKVIGNKTGVVTIRDWKLFGSNEFISSVPYKNQEPFYCLSRQIDGFQNFH